MEMDTKVETKSLKDSIVEQLAGATEDGVMAKEIRKALRANFPNLTKTDINKVLYGLEREGKAIRNAEDFTWRAVAVQA